MGRNLPHIIRENRIYKEDDETVCYQYDDTFSPITMPIDLTPLFEKYNGTI